MDTLTLTRIKTLADLNGLSFNNEPIHLMYDRVVWGSNNLTSQEVKDATSKAIIKVLTHTPYLIEKHMAHQVGMSLNQLMGDVLITNRGPLFYLQDNDTEEHWVVNIETGTIAKHIENDDYRTVGTLSEARRDTFKALAYEDRYLSV